MVVAPAYPWARIGEEVAVLERITWFRQSALRWVVDERTIYIDPWGTPEDAPPADLILITHAHHDHFRPEEIERLADRLDPGRRPVTSRTN